MQSSKVWSFVAASVMVGSSSAVAGTAVEWKRSVGGNGHWYEAVAVTKKWSECVDLALARHGHLVTIADAAEDDFVRTLVDANGYWLGASAPENQGLDPNAYSWVTGEPFIYSRWGPGEPNISSNHRALCYELWYSRRFWNNNDPDCLEEPGYYIEWDADCNGDGFVDYGQILSGELSDTNQNGVPDCCEDGSCPVDTNLIVNAGFESGSPLNACSVESVGAGNLVASGWQVSEGIVDRARGGVACTTSTRPTFGDYCVDLCGTPASSGAIRQLVPTVPAHKYRCTFWLSGDASAGPSTKKVHAKVGTYIDLTFTFACSGTGAQGWVSNQFEFTARGANEPLEFVADNGVTTGGPMLDAINLVDITTQCVGDLDASGEVDGADIALLLLNFGPCTTGP